MSVEFHALSGSPFSWKVWLALEHKQIPYSLVMRSADAGDLRTPEFLALNPRGKVPVIVDRGFVLHESTAIVEYLDEAFAGPPLWPTEARARAIARRLSLEATDHVYPPTRKLVTELLGKRASDPPIVDEATAALASELDRFASRIERPFLVGAEPTAADYTLYPLVAIVAHRLARRAELGRVIPQSIRAWMERVEGLTFYPRTYPPHWREQ